MPASHTPAFRLRQAVTPALPQGDPSNLAALRELLDNRHLLVQLLQSGWPGEGRVTVGGDAAAPSLAVDAMEPVAVRDEDVVWHPAGSGATTVLPGPLAASTVHYLYLRAATDGTRSFVVTTTAPTTALYRATGDELQRHVATFCTGLLGFPLPAVVGRRSGKYIASSGRAELVALDNGRATAWSPVSLAALVPPSATTAWVMARAYCSADDIGTDVQVRRSSVDDGYLVVASASARARVAAGTPINQDGYEENLVQVPLLGRSFEYRLSAAVTAANPCGARFTVVGWE